MARPGRVQRRQELRHAGRHHVARVVEPVTARQDAHGIRVLRGRDVGLRHAVEEGLALELHGTQSDALALELGRLAAVELRKRRLLLLRARRRVEPAVVTSSGDGSGPGVVHTGSGSDVPESRSRPSVRRLPAFWCTTSVSVVVSPSRASGSASSTTSRWLSPSAAASAQPPSWVRPSIAAAAE